MPSCRISVPWLLLVAIIAAFPDRPAAAPPDAKMLRPIEAHDSVFLEEMTWLEVRDALKAGKTTVIIPTGGVEMNGPYLPTGKHNYIVKAVAEATARKLGNTLVAPVVPFVPEGDIDPPTSHMEYPGTISLTEKTYEAMLTEIVSCFRTHGFQHIVLIGDSSGNQDGMRNVAAALNKRWAKEKVRVHFIAEYYDEFDALEEWVTKQGIVQKDEGFHDDFITSATLAAIDPTFIRAKQRQAAKNLSINGVSLAPVETAAAWGKKIIDYRAETTVKAIRKATGS